MRSPAFTLVELAAVILILGIVAGAVALRLNDPLRRAGIEGVLTEFEGFNHLARTAAREQDRPLRMVFDLDAGAVRRTDERGRSAGTEIALPDGYHLARLVVAGKESYSGRVSVTCSRQGLTPTYAIQVEAPGKVRTWLLVAGLSGQAMRTSDEDAIRETFEAIQGGRDAR